MKTKDDDMITPAEYFRLNPTACQPAQEFCAQFPTMREAWMSDDAHVRWMLWAVGRDPANARRIAEFAYGCAAHDQAGWSTSAAAYAAAGWATSDSAEAATSAAGWAAEAAESAEFASSAAESERQRQRNHLRYLFQRMFID